MQRPETSGPSGWRRYVVISLQQGFGKIGLIGGMEAEASKKPRGEDKAKPHMLN